MDIEPILTQPISDFAIDDFIEISDENDVSEVCLQVLTTGLHVVKNSDNFPLGVLDYEIATALLETQGPLSAYIQSLALVGVCPSETQMRNIMSTVEEFGSVPWFLLQSEEKYVGLAPPVWIFQNLRQYFRQRSVQAKKFWTNLRARTIFDTLDRSLIDPVITPTQPLCYCCPIQFNNQNPHRVPPVDVIVAPNGQRVCRYHSSQRVSPSIGCTAC